MLKIAIATVLGCVLWLGIIMAFDGTDSKWLGLALPLGYLTGFAVRLTLAARRNERAASSKRRVKGRTGAKGRASPKASPKGKGRTAPRPGRRR
jgi:hypothetical protein